jgi:Kef-type K+ transport system membrane component KefB
MAEELISLTFVALIAALSPLIAKSIPGRPVPEVVLLLAAGAILGPNMLGAIQITESITLLSDLGVAFLFLLAGYEIEPSNLTNRQGKRGLITWLITFALAFGAVLIIPGLPTFKVLGITVAIALTTTALGTLLPILKERGLFGTEIGGSVLAYGTYGELGPVLAMAILLSSRAGWKTMLILAFFLGIAVLTAFLGSRSKKKESKLYNFLVDNADSSSQTVVRAVVLLLVFLVAIPAIFDIDIVIGAFAAGFVLRYLIPEGSGNMEAKIDGIAYGFFIPLFFVVSGAKINISAVFAKPLMLVIFILLLLFVRTLPIIIALLTDKEKKSMPKKDKFSIAFYCTAALPIIVAVTSLAVNAGAMAQDTASVLVTAGAVTILIMPLLAMLLTKKSK